MFTLFDFVEVGTFTHLVLHPRAPIVPPLLWIRLLTKGIANLSVDPLGTPRNGMEGPVTEWQIRENMSGNAR